MAKYHFIQQRHLYIFFWGCSATSKWSRSLFEIAFCLNMDSSKILYVDTSNLVCTMKVSYEIVFQYTMFFKRIHKTFGSNCRPSNHFMSEKTVPVWRWSFFFYLRTKWYCLPKASLTTHLLRYKWLKSFTLNEKCNLR